MSITALRKELRAKEEYLQSTCEEIESSAEELKSSNEEMQSVNTQLQTKVADLSRVNNDMNNLLKPEKCMRSRPPNGKQGRTISNHEGQNGHPRDSGLGTWKFLVGYWRFFSGKIQNIIRPARQAASVPGFDTSP